MKFFYEREELDDRVVYRLHNAWVPFVAAWLLIASAAAWYFGPPALLQPASWVLAVCGAFLALRWVVFLGPNAEMLKAKYSGRMTASGSKFSIANPPVITLKKGEGAGG